MFEKDIEIFKNFLRDETQPIKIIWVYPENVAKHKNTFFIKEFISNENEIINQYKIFRDKNLSVTFNQLGVFNSQSVCYLTPWGEGNKEPATNANIRIHHEKVHFKEVRSSLYFRIIKYINRLQGYVIT